MLHSMTGFGQAELNLNGRNISITVKSVNSKNADLSIKLPSAYRDKELELRSLLIDKLQRGKIDFQIQLDQTLGDKVYAFNKEVFNEYFRQLKDLAEGKDVSQDNLFSLASKMPNVLNQESEEAEGDDWNEILKGVSAAIAQLTEFRKNEGAVLEKDLNSRVIRIMSLLEDIKSFEGERIETVKTRINTQLENLQAGENVNRDRFEQEIIYYLEKLDITEEKVRLTAHCNLFNETMNQPESQGRKLNFVSQEMGREINTIGSKANHAEIQKIVVEMKDELEKIKEQLFNIL